MRPKRGKLIDLNDEEAAYVREHHREVSVPQMVKGLRQRGHRRTGSTLYAWMRHHDLPPYSPLADALARNAQLGDALTELVALKTHKEQFGETEEYKERQPLAWKRARLLVQVFLLRRIENRQYNPK